MSPIFIVLLQLLLGLSSIFTNANRKTQRLPTKLNSVSPTLAASNLSRSTFTTKEFSDSTKFEDTIVDLALSIERRLPLDHKKSKVALGKFTFGESAIPSPFMYYFCEKLAIALKQFTSLSVVKREEMMQMIKMRSPFLTRGDIPVSEQGITEILQTDLFITGSGWEKENLLQVWLHVFEKKSAGRLFSKKITFSRDLVPNNYPLAPSNYAELKNALTNLSESSNRIQNSELKVDVWVDRVDGIYESGDNVLVYVRTNQPAYLRLFYHVANGQVMQIFPNRFAANDYIAGNKVLIFGDDNDSFELVVVPPFGTEIIKAFACTEKFEKVNVKELKNGLMLVTDSTQGMADKIRGVVFNKDTALFGEATCVITTVETLRKKSKN